jgi:2-polyprenyl-3-methyl-5-hydroxy-6-metoxy-1,4-benzoquinol methylase
MKEIDIRPKEVFAKYLELSKADAKKFFKDKENRYDINCPACDSEVTEISFIKDEFSFKKCSNCESLFVSPRPPKDIFDNFYKNSVSSNYWAEVFFPAVAETRRELIFKERALKVLEYCKLKDISHNSIMDVGAGHGIFLEEWKKVSLCDNVYALEPGEKLANICRIKNIETLEKFSEDANEWKHKADIVTCFEVFEHVHSPLKFVSSIKSLAKPGGTVLISGLTIDGFDIQYLWEESKSISPPHHLNFLSVMGIKILFETVGFKDIEILTPGKLDFDIVKNYIQENDDSIYDNNRFVNKIIERGRDAEIEFQDFLQKNKLSSHFWIFAKS